MNNSGMHVNVFFPGEYASESFLLGGAESHLPDVCSDKNKRGVPGCKQDAAKDPDGNGIYPDQRDDYVTFMARDQVAATQFNHLFGVAIEDAYARTGYAFKNDDTHWLELERFLPGETGVYVPASKHGVPPEAGDATSMVPGGG